MRRVPLLARLAVRSCARSPLLGKPGSGTLSLELVSR